MALKLVNIGTSVNSKDGDVLRTAFDKINQNFTELYNTAAADATDRLVKDSSTVVLSSNGIITLPSSSYLESTDINLKVGAQGTLTIRSDAASNLTTKEWVFDRSGTLNVPHMLPKSFTATVDDAHYAGSLTLSGSAWYFSVTFNVTSSGSVETLLDNNPWPSNPGYTNGMEFTFTEEDHGIPDYTFTLVLNSIQNPGPGVYTVNPAVSQPPAYPATFKNGEAIKLVADASPFIFGADGRIHLPDGGDIVDSNGASVLGGAGSGTSVIAGDVAPTNPTTGDLWYDTVGGRMYVYFDNTWVDANPVDGVGNSTSVGDFAFVSNVMYNIGGAIIENSDLTHGPTSALILPVNSSDPNTAQLNNFYGAVEINTGYNNAHKWSFGTDASLTFPDNHLTINGSTIGRSVISGNDISGSRLTFTDTTTSLETYSDPDGLNNTAMARSYTSNLVAGFEVYQEDLAGRTGTSLVVTGGGVDITGGDGILSNIWSFGIDGTFTFPNNTVQTTAYQTASTPGSSKGVSGNKAGMVAFDNSNFYYCKQDYTDGVDDIWVKVAWTSVSW